MGYKLRLSVLEIDGKPILAGKHEEKLIHPSPKISNEKRSF